MASRLRFLYLEDDIADAELARDTLELDGFACDVIRVETEPAFRSALQQGGFDVILADYALPSFDGLSALKITLQQRPDLPFIFVSGTMGEEVAIEALKIGATDYVLKTRLSRLVPSVNRALREARERAELRRTEEALRRSETELRQMLETIPAMVWSALPDGSNVLVNSRWEAYTGSSAAGLGWQAAAHPDDLKRHFDAFRACSAAGLPFADEVRFRRADGHYRWFLVQATPLKDKQGKVFKWYGIVTDIQDRKRAEALLTGEKRILEMVAKGNPLPQILDGLCHLAEEQASGVLASILLLDENRLRHGGAPSLPTAYTDAIDGASIGPSAGSCGTAAYRREQVIVEDIATDPLWADYRDLALPHGLRACWSTPVFSSQGNVIATFAMYYREPRSPSGPDREVIEQITHLAGGAIESKHTQEALRHSEAYLAQAQRLAKTGSWAYDHMTEKALYWSDEMFRIHGLERQQGPPTSEAFLEHVHPDDRESVHEAMLNAVQEKTEYEVEHRIILPDGTIRHVHALGRPVLSGSGDVVEVVGSAVDITERKHAEEALLRSEAYLAEGQRLTRTGSWALNVVTGEPLHSSAEHTRLFGLDPEKGMPSFGEFLRSVHPEDRGLLIETFQTLARSGGDLDFQYRIAVPGGPVRHLRAIGHPVSSGAPDEYVGITIDVTERKRADHERERLRQLEADLAHMNRVSMMGELAASLSHEIRQPLAGAVTNASICLRSLNSDRPNLEAAREAASRMVRDSMRSAEIIDRTSSLYKKAAPQREPVDINEVINEITGLLPNEASRWGISIVTKLAPHLPKIMGDRVQLQQVLLNLAINGVDAMKRVDGIRELRLSSKQDPTGAIVVSVADTGAGLPPEMNKIFDAFFTTKPHGTGMGLAISRTIIESHGGSLSASAQADGGAMFYFTLPIAVGASA